MPVNYQMDVINPFQAALQGYGAGAQILQQRQQAQTAQVEQGQKSQLFEAQMQEAQMRTQALQDARAKAEAAQVAYAELYKRMSDPDFLAKTSAGDIAIIALTNPEAAKLIQTEIQKHGDEKKLAGFNQNWSIASALQMNNPQQADELLDQYATAFENSGRTADGAAMRALREKIKTPEGRDIVMKTTFANASLILPDQYDKLRKGLYETIKLPYELRKLNLEADQLSAANSGVLPKGDVVKLEDAYRQEYTKAAAPYKSMQESMSSIFASAKIATPAGDVALVTQFRKLLDPTSVVRESEFAQTAEAGSLITKLEGELSKVSGEGMIAPSMRNQIVALGRELMVAADGYERKRREDIDYRAKIHGLDTKAIYGVGAVGERPTTLPDYANMPKSDLQKAMNGIYDITNSEELKAITEAWGRMTTKGGGK